MKQVIFRLERCYYKHSSISSKKNSSFFQVNTSLKIQLILKEIEAGYYHTFPLLFLLDF